MVSDSFRQQLRTVQLVPITAFDASGNLDLAPMRQHTRRMHEAGIRCFIPAAGSAEFHSLSSAEIVSAVAMTRETIGDNGGLVLAPVGQQIREALQLGKDSLAAGASAVLVMPLGHPYLSDAGVRDYLLDLLEELPGPVLVYKTGPIPSDDLLLELAEHPNLAGVKYAVNDVDAFQRIVQNDNDRLEWICGSAERFAPYFMLRATGYTSGAGNLCPKLTLSMHKAIVEERWSDAMYWQKFIRPIEDFRARSGSSYNVSFLKYAIRATGLDFGDVRRPQRRLTAAEMQEADRVVAAALAAEQELT